MARIAANATVSRPAQPHVLLDARAPQEADFFVAVPNPSEPQRSSTVSDEQQPMELSESPVQPPGTPERNTDPEYLPTNRNDSAEVALKKRIARMNRHFIHAENEKRQKYSDVANFSPIVISERGALGPETQRLWRVWGRHLPSMAPVTQEWSHVLLRSHASTQEF